MGTLRHVSLVLSCVIFKIPNIARENLPLIYFKQALASNSVLKAPIAINVSVYPIRGSPIRGVDKTSPIAPLPFALGRTILYLSKLMGLFI